MHNPCEKTLYLYCQVLQKVRKIGNMADRAVHPLCTQHGITGLQLGILLFLHNGGPQTISAIAQNIGMAGANNSALCKRLEKKGLLQRERDENDERQVLVHLTPEGERLLDEMNGQCGEWQQRLLTHISIQEIEQALEAMETVVAAMEAAERICTDG